jgi:ASC-1-like (ASCH) protein
VFIEPYLQFILDGQKTVESRFSANRSAPYQQVGKGDVVLLKRTGGPVMGVGSVFLE